MTLRSAALLALLPLAWSLLAPPPARAAAESAGDVMPLVRADRWDEAAAEAARYPDPVVPKLVTYFRLLAPGMGSLAEISAFMRTNPDWPLQSLLARRRDEALASDADAAGAARECARLAPQATAAMLRCAEVLAGAGQPGPAAAMARAVWTAGIADAGWEQRFLRDFGAVLRPADQRARFERLLRESRNARQDAALERQIARLPPADQAAARVRLALRGDDPRAAALLAALPQAALAEPAMFLDRAAWMRRTGMDEAAQTLWIAGGHAAETAAGPLRGAFWFERNIMARRRLREGDAAGAYAIAAGHAQTAVEPALDVEFLAGFIALRRLSDPAKALPHFRRLATLSQAAITQGRAWYWLGRAEEAAGNAPSATADYTAAAKWPSTFYGQLAALKLGDSAAALDKRILDVGDPPLDERRAMALAGREITRAAAWLARWGEQRRAQPFLLRLDEITPDPADHILVARLALALNMPETAVAVARRAGRDGQMLLRSGWPAPVTPPDADNPEPALALGVMRQESSFDTATLSPAGARGLMQLMPGTASTVARKLGVAVSVPALVLDPAYNMRLGSAYLQQLLDRYQGSTMLAVAAYNAGPARVDEWIATNGDPRGAGVDPLDWIELIPFGETRNYVQRVIENQMVYRALRGETEAYPIPLR
jgi:soluble lytic murein transglycosylase